VTGLERTEGGPWACEQDGTRREASPGGVAPACGAPEPPSGGRYGSGGRRQITLIIDGSAEGRLWPTCTRG